MKYKLIEDKRGLAATVLAAIVTGLAGIVMKSNILLVIAAFIFFLGFMPIISLPTVVWVIIILIIIFIVTGGKKK